MKKYIVSFVDFFESKMEIEVVEAATPENAIKKAYTKNRVAKNPEGDHYDLETWIDEMPLTEDDIKLEFKIADIIIDVKELKD